MSASYFTSGKCENSTDLEYAFYWLGTSVSSHPPPDPFHFLNLFPLVSYKRGLPQFLFPSYPPTPSPVWYPWFVFLCLVYFFPLCVIIIMNFLPSDVPLSLSWPTARFVLPWNSLVTSSSPFYPPIPSSFFWYTSGFFFVLFFWYSFSFFSFLSFFFLFSPLDLLLHLSCLVIPFFC